MSDIAALKLKFHGVWSILDERTRRIMAASEAVSLGYGGVSLVHRACGLSRKAIHKGIKEIKAGVVPAAGHIRRAGAGRKSLTASDPGLLAALEERVEGETRGDPQSPLRWTTKNTRHMAVEQGSGCKTKI